MNHRSLLAVVSLLLVLSLNQAIPAEPLSEADAEKLFTQKIAPLLKSRCLSCHGEGKELKGELDLRTRASILKGGESGPAVIAGKPELSWLYRSVRYDDEIKMPPKERIKERLTDLQLRWVHDWIEAGAPWPATVDMAKVTPARKPDPHEDPTNPGTRLPDYSTKPPDYQYKHGDIVIPAAHANEPVLPVWSLKKAVKYVDDGALAWTRQRQCVACHTNGAYMMIRPALTPYLGPPLEEVKKLFAEALGKPYMVPPQSDPIFQLQVAWGLAEWDGHVSKQLSPETDRAMRLLCSVLSKEGQWRNHSSSWVPYILNSYHNACLFAKAIGTAPGWLDKVRADGDTKTLEAVERLRKYLQSGAAKNDYDRVYLLWADLRWPGLIDAEKRRELLEMIGRHQRPDGGWSLRSFGAPQSWGNGGRAAKLTAEAYGDNPPSDGHMTGLALIVMREAGVPVDDPRIRKGVAWLKANQRESGRWWTRSLNTDYWQYSTYHGSAHALLALGLCGEIPRRER